MYLGIDYGGTNLKTGIFSADGKIIKFEANKLSEFTSQDNLLDNLINHSIDFTQGYEIEKGGLAIKGLVNTKEGKVEDDIGAGSLLAGKNLRKAFGDALGVPFNLENDARAYAWGEYKFGAGKGSRAMVCMTLGTGLGCSLVADDKPYQGSDPLGGLLGGHISIDRNGHECPCGNKGCLELYCSATAFSKIVQEEHSELASVENTLETFFDSIRNGNKSYLVTLNEFQENLSIGIVNVIHAYGPDMVVIGGGVMNSSDLILPKLIEKVHKRAWTFPRGKVQIKASLLGNKAAAMGVAFL